MQENEDVAPAQDIWPFWQRAKRGPQPWQSTEYRLSQRCSNISHIRKRLNLMRLMERHTWHTNWSKNICPKIWQCACHWNYEPHRTNGNVQQLPKKDRINKEKGPLTAPFIYSPVCSRRRFFTSADVPSPSSTARWASRKAAIVFNVPKYVALWKISQHKVSHG